MLEFQCFVLVLLLTDCISLYCCPAGHEKHQVSEGRAGRHTGNFGNESILGFRRCAANTVCPTICARRHPRQKSHPNDRRISFDNVHRGRTTPCFVSMGSSLRKCARWITEFSQVVSSCRLGRNYFSLNIALRNNCTYTPFDNLMIPIMAT